MTDLETRQPPATRDRWRELAARTVSRPDVTPDTVEELLATTTYDGIRLRPLYTAADAPPPASPLVRGPAGAGTDLRQRYADPDPAVTRRAIRADLDGGATSLWLVVGDDAIPVAALPGILADVDLDIVPVVVDGRNRPDVSAAALAALPSTATGGLGLDPSGQADWATDATGLALRCAERFPGLRAFTVDATVYHDAGASDAQEIGCAVAAGVACLRALTAAGMSPAQAAGQLEFRFAATTDQFATIAKLRAARRLWERVGEVCGLAPADRVQRQHAVTSSAMLTRRDPWTNLLRTTVACFGAVVGGAGAVTMQPFDAALGAPGDLGRRLARNTAAILHLESYAGRVLDPAGGSWFLESFTDELSQRGWELFTRSERAGGLAAALRSGVIEAEFAATRAERDRNVAHRRDVLVGISDFADLSEPAPPPAVPHGPSRRAQPYERLRDRSDQWLARTGQRPAIFLATVGPEAETAARAGFARNLFAAGGIEVHPGGDSTDPAVVAAAFAASGTRIACLASSDALYLNHAPAMIDALRAAGAHRIWLAGRPGTVTGVDTHVYAGCDALAALRAAYDDLEAPDVR